MNNIVPIPRTTAPLFGATRAQIVSGRLKEFLGAALNRLGVPGTIRPTHIHDEVTGLNVEVRVEALFTVVTIDGRDFYFRRVSGGFDGTGSAL